MPSPLETCVRRIRDRGQPGQPLFAYQTTDSELAELRQGLSDTLHIRFDLRPAEAAAFCLFGAEWFRRQHEAGHWSWETILRQGLSLSGDHLRAVRQRYTRDYTDRGMQWWSRPVVFVETFRYLGTLVCEGGLPLNVLQKDQAAITRFLRASLEQYERFPDAPVLEQVQREQWRLPRTLRADVVAQWASEVVRVVAGFRKVLQKESNRDGDVLQRLERVDPTWQSKLPMAVNDDAARTLLKALLQEVDRAIAASEDLAIITCLDRSGIGEPRVVRRFHSSPYVTMERLQRMFQVSDLPPQFELALVVGDQAIVCGKVQQLASQAECRLSTLEGRELSSAAATQSVFLRASLGGQPVGKDFDLRGGALLPETPWIFADDDGRLLGTGGIRTKQASVLVAHEVGGAIAAVEGQVEPLAAATRLRRQVVRVTGTAIARSADGGDEFHMETAASTEDAIEHQLRGRQVQLGPSGSVVWLGLPEIYEVSADHLEGQRLPANRLQWKPRTGRAGWQTVDEGCLGDVTLRVVSGARCTARYSLTVLPARFACHLKPGREAHTGQLEVENLPARRLQAGSQLQLTIAVHEISPGRFALDVRDERPAVDSHVIDLQIDLGQHRQADIRVCSPVQGVWVLDAAGRAVALNGETTLPLSALDGLRLVVSLPEARGQPPCLIDCDSGAEFARLRPYDEQHFVFGMGLALAQSSLAAGLGTSDDPGHCARLELLRYPNDPQPLRTLLVAEHAGNVDLQRGPEEYYITIPARVLAWPFVRHEDVRLVVHRLGDDQETASESAVTRCPDRDAAWAIDRTQLRAGPWLATAWIREDLCLHPSLLEGLEDPRSPNGAAGPTPVDRDEFTAVLEHPDRAERLAYWKALLQAASNDPRDLVWGHIDRLIESCRRLPVTTYEAVSALTQVPEAAAMWGARRAAEDRHELWDRLERLPFFWGLIPIWVWGKIWSQLVQGYPPEVARMVEEAFLRQAPRCSSAMNVVVACLSAAGILPRKPEWVAQFVSKQVAEHIAQITRRRSELMTRHDQQHQQWPGRAFRLPKLVQEQLRSLDFDEMAGWQCSVLCAPVYCAWQQVHASEFPDRETVVQCKQIQAFDPEWFRLCQHHAAMVFASRRFHHEPDWVRVVAD